MALIEGLTAAEAGTLFKAVESTRNIGQALQQTGLASRISENAARHIINWGVKQRGNMAALRALRALQAAEAAGAGGGLLSTATATLAGVSWATVGVGVLVGTLIVGGLGAVWVQFTKDQPIAATSKGDPETRKQDGTYLDGVQPVKVKGPAIPTKTKTATKASSPKAWAPLSKPAEPWGVFLVGDDVMIGKKSEIENRTLNSMSKWGTDATKKVGQVAELKLLAGPFENEKEAYEAFVGLVEDGSAHTLPLRGGSKAKFTFDGKIHAINNTPAPPKVKWKP